MVFCSVDCWEVHLPVANHRESWALEKRSPTRAEHERAAAAEAAKERAPRRRIVREAPAPARGSGGASSSGASASTGAAPREVLIIASRLKDYIRASSGLNTSDRVLEPLSDIVREVCDRAVRNAVADERKTVLDRDIPRR